MKPVFLLFLLSLFSSRTAADCENGWLAYKDELCIKLFTTTFLGYDEARDFCSFQGNENGKATLVMVKESDFQDVLADYTHDLYDNVWLGGKYDYQTEQFKWEDGEPLSYTNWQEGYPRNITDSEEEVCIELRPRNAKDSTKSEGNWADAICAKRNLVICQLPYVWTMQDAINEIIRLRKDVKVLKSRVIPVGQVYIEYYDQPSPETLWPDLTWEDITATYEGLFFRAAGGDATSWGAIQQACAPRISQMGLYHSSENTFQNPLSFPSSGWSEWGWAGELFYLGGGKMYEGLRFNVESCEVRPRNQAVRIWKRTA